ncbi:ethanolamine ammonia-lyase reactivating factor EutA [Natronorubrum aibiense]|uniref:Reactivating factor for ethanolamine ammonia lyase n=1 Tax=Natronorubrum aibiense TaxID=348826 RepID=A0A5P9P8U9_9EURY|nr:ethanolamine ammonia-lyase reactivating factor EutA [Natronorubrum aibiense]QFU84310.1 reactivating factor for ethanolamine ammonia lyase [Natronorubrum aibiense]
MSNHSKTLTSIGVDVGTTTTHAVVSHLRVETLPGSGTSPTITDREIVHRGTVRETPLVDPETIDVDRVAAIIDSELAAGGVTPAEIDTGAVIVTGETARRENAEPLVHRLADNTGQFVAATAGASLEAVLAGRGSGAEARAAELGGCVANVDIGGGTTNVAIFDAAESNDNNVTVRETRCLDIGGRLVTFDDADRVTSISPPARTIVEAVNLPITVGSSPDKAALKTLAVTMADLIVDLCTGPPFDALTRVLAIGTLPDEPLDLNSVVFSGGVGRLIASPPADPFAYNDLGGMLAAAIATHDRVRSWSVFDPTEDIRATVAGAGTETIKLSGRTVSLDLSLLPLRNAPVVAVSDLVDCSDDQLERRFEVALETLTDLHDPDAIDGIALSIDEVGPLMYERLKIVVGALAAALHSIPSSLPVVVVTRQNCAKALGQMLRREIDQPLIVIDEIPSTNGDYLDIGKPVADNGSVPVVVKTLVFGQ